MDFTGLRRGGRAYLPARIAEVLQPGKPVEGRRPGGAFRAGFEGRINHYSLGGSIS